MPVYNSSGVEVVTSAASAGINVKEVDGSPNVTGVTIVRFPNGSLTDDGGGQVTYAAASLPITFAVEGYKTVVNSVTPLTLISTSISGGAVGANGQLKISGTYTGIIDTNRTITFTLTLGATTLIAPALSLLKDASGSQVIGQYHFSMINQNDSAVNRTAFVTTYSLYSMASNTLKRTLTDNWVTGATQMNTTTVNTASTNTLSLTVTLSAANAGFGYYSHGVTAETIYTA